MEIINYFSPTFSPEIFVQGFVFTICLTLGIFMILSDQRDYFSGVDNFKSYRDKLSTLLRSYVSKIALQGFFRTESTQQSSVAGTQFVVALNVITLLGIFIMATFVSGTIIHSVSDKWMAAGNDHHLGLKQIWINPTTHEIEMQFINVGDSLNRKIQTGDAIKINSFEKVFDDLKSQKFITLDDADAIDKRKKQIKEIYFMARHEMLTDAVWRDYLSSSQNLINITESFALSFFILVWMCYLNLFINLFRDFYKSKNSTAALFIPLLVLLAINLFVFLYINNSIWVFIFYSSFPLLAQFIISGIAVKYPGRANSFYSLTSVLLIYISLTGYYFSSLAWLQNTQDLTAKTFGVYRYINPDLKKTTRENAFKVFDINNEK